RAHPHSRDLRVRAPERREPADYVDSYVALRTAPRLPAAHCSISRPTDHADTRRALASTGLTEAVMTAPIWLKGYDEGVPTTLEPYPDRTLLDYLSESARKWPDRPFLLFKGSKITYAQIEKE